MVYKCKICGGDLELEENLKIATCEYCGNKQVLPKTSSEKQNRLYDRAMHFKENNEYDKAIAILEEILLENSTDCDVYWQLALCEYGVEYVKDKKTGQYIPTCNRINTTPILINNNYKNALKYADNDEKKVYEEEGKKINDIQKNAIEIANKEEPFDIFICYKETDENGSRTEDSVIAQDLYNILIKEGYKVFFAKITLENKLGTEYEPYIFSALNSSKIMITVGTKKENLESPWVRNEWSRFLTLCKQEKQKILIPTYKNMSPYDMPEEFAHLQAIDLGKIGVIEDLKNKIASIIKNTGSKTKTKEKKKKRKKIIIFFIIFIVLLFSIILGINIINKTIIPAVKYKDANKLMAEEKYNEALVIFEELGNYADSKDKITECNNKIKEEIDAKLKKYIGTYDKTKMQNYLGNEEPFGYSLIVESASSSGIRIDLTYDHHKVTSFSAKAHLDENGKYTFLYKDTWRNSGEGTLELLEDGIKINITNSSKDGRYDNDMGEQELIFKFSDMTKEK